MPLLALRSVELHPYQFQYPCRPVSLHPTYSDFEQQLSKWVRITFRVQPSNILWLTSPVWIYRNISNGNGMVVDGVCQIKFPNLITKHIQLQFKYNCFALRIREVFEETKERINLFQDPLHRMLCRWGKPMNSSYVVLNSDGSVKKDRAGIGCIIRNGQGTMLLSHAAICQNMPVYAVELWGIREGLRLTLEYRKANGGASSIVIDSDSLVATNFVRAAAASFSSLVNKCKAGDKDHRLADEPERAFRGMTIKADNDDDLKNYVKSVITDQSRSTKGIDGLSLGAQVQMLVDILHYLEDFDNWGCKHVYRETNRAADFLSKYAETDEVMFSNPRDCPDELCQILAEDANDNVWYQRKT